MPFGFFRKYQDGSVAELLSGCLWTYGRGNRFGRRPHADAEFAESPNVMPNQSLPMCLAHGDSALLFVGCTALQDEVDQNQQIMCHGDHRFGRALRGNTPELFPQMPAFLS